jgi:alpha-mannosidase
VVGDVVWVVQNDNSGQGQQRWPLFHPSEADPDAGYRQYAYTIVFRLDTQPQDAHVLRIDYLTIAPRLAQLEFVVNGVAGRAYLRPHPSQSSEIRLLSGLHTAIYSEGRAEIIVPAALLHAGENRIVLIARDSGETIAVERIEAIRRLDRMASGAGLIYQALAFARLADTPAAPVARLQIAPSVLYRRDMSGALVEPCNIYIELAGGISATTLRLELREGEREQQIDIPLPATSFGHVHAVFDLFDGAGAVEYFVAGCVNKQEFQQSGTLARRRKWNVYVTPHAM